MVDERAGLADKRPSIALIYRAATRDRPSATLKPGQLAAIVINTARLSYYFAIATLSRSMPALKPLTFSSSFTILVLLSACSSGSDSPADTGTGLNEASCALQYTETTPGTQTGSDPLIGDQWHLNNTGQTGGTPGEDAGVFNAWNRTLGSSVRVAVVDDAIEVTHEDLVANVVPGKSFNYRPARLGSSFPLPCNTSDSHGTAVAGLVSASRNNARGGSGVAPETELVGFNALATGIDSDIADALNKDLAEISLYNNSWGSPDNGKLNTAESSFIQAIDNGIRNGRGGKGAIFVFPAGNGGCYAQDQSGQCYRENSNYDGYVNKLGQITACAVDHDGKRPFYGETGANFLVCGNSSNNTTLITTTDIQNRYRSTFSGTSASTPIVAGVAALILAENPQLTWRDVQQILIRTARKNDSADSGWTTDFGLNFNPRYGFGTVDAEAAVALASTWTSIGGSESLKQCGPFSSAPNVGLADPSPAIDTQEDIIAVSGCSIDRIEFIEVKPTATHEYGGDLRISLTSPAGLVSPLASERVCSSTGPRDACGPYSDWPFGLVRHMDEPSNGNWTLRVADAAVQDTGSFDRWSITFHGR